MMVEQMDMMERGSVRRRRRHDDEFKQQVLAECDEPGASVAQVALTHGINANLVHTWRREARDKAKAATPVPAPGEPAFIAVAMTPSPAPVAGDIRIELRRGATTVSVRWPLGAAGECAAWLREILR
jgi:transposase